MNETELRMKIVLTSTLQQFVLLSVRVDPLVTVLLDSFTQFRRPVNLSILVIAVLMDIVSHFVIIIVNGSIPRFTPNHQLINSTRQHN